VCCNNSHLVNKALQRRVQDLEKINVDLERRLEDQAKERIAVEHECAEIERHWRERYSKLEKEMEHMRQLMSKEKMQNDRLVSAWYSLVDPRVQNFSYRSPFPWHSVRVFVELSANYTVFFRRNMNLCVEASDK
jgi:hypothetical protein